MATFRIAAKLEIATPLRASTQLDVCIGSPNITPACLTMRQILRARKCSSRRLTPKHRSIPSSNRSFDRFWPNGDCRLRPKPAVMVEISAYCKGGFRSPTAQSLPSIG